MHRLHHGTLGLLTSCTVAMLFVLTAAIVGGGAAEAQRISKAISVAVMPLADRTGRNSDMISEKATDAVALALEDTQEYVVTTRADTRREMEALGIFRIEAAKFSPSEEQMVRLGERLRVEKVAAGSVDHLSIDGSGRSRCVITVRLLDVTLREYLDGATAEYTTRPIPGWKGEEAEVINEALRSAAEAAVTEIQTSRRPRGNVDMVDQTGTIIVNLGFRDGIEIGMELLVVRGVWNAAEERVVLRKVGVAVVSQVEVHVSHCRLAHGAMPRAGDKVYVMYRPTTRVIEAHRAARLKSNLRILAAAGALLGIVNTARGQHSQSAPGVAAHLIQAAPGEEPRVRVGATGKTTARYVHGWLVFRGESAGFPPEVNNQNFLIAARRGERLEFFDDEPSLVIGIEFGMEFTYLDEEGEQEDGEVEITYNHLPLVAGRTYYYKLRRISDPGRVRIPISTTQEDELEDVDFDIDPPDSLSDASGPAGPITYFYPGTPETPSDGNTAVDWRGNYTSFTWRPATGADQYRVMIFNNAHATGNPVAMSGDMPYTGGATMNWRLNTNLGVSSTYYWFIASRRVGQAEPVVESNGMRGWVLSRPYRFTTVAGPPSPPTSAVAGPDQTPRPPRRTGLWGDPIGER